MNEKPQKYFDDILKFLSRDYNRQYAVYEIVDHLMSQNKIKNHEKSMIREQTGTDVKNSLLFLSNDALVLYNPNFETVYITSKGFVKIKTEGFQKEIKNKRLNIRYSGYLNR